MHRLIALFVIMASFISARAFDGLAEGDKAALLMVHFGTTYDDTRAATIDAINAKARAEFPDMRVEEAYTSRIVISRLAKRGVTRLNPRQALLKLAAEGYTHVFIQSTNVIDGIEAAALRAEADYMVPFFKEVRVGRPLLYSVDDCLKVVSEIASRHAAAAEGKGSVVLVGHGTHTPANAIYSQVDYMFTATGHPRFHVATVEGYPTLDDVIARLKAEKARSVLLVPFMFVAGDHARNDIDGEWRDALVKEGFTVSTALEGLGQIPAIQDIYIDHIRDGLRERPLSPVERKAAFLNDNL